MDDINKKMDELYQEYLNEKLDLIFGENKKLISSKEENTSYKSQELIDSKTYKIIRRHNRYNFAYTDGNLLSFTWYDWAGDFCNGYAIVKKDDLGYNFIDTNGKLISDTWYRDVEDFCNGYARVFKIYGGWNFIDTKGNLICDEWYDEVWNFHDGRARVNRGSKYNFVDTKGRPISEEWYTDAMNFHDGCAQVRAGYEEYNFIDTRGRPICDEWYDKVWNFCNGYAKVKKGSKYNFVDTKGRPISDRWYDMLEDFQNGFAMVMEYDEGYNYINPEGELISDIWYNSGSSFVGNYAVVTNKAGEYGYIDNNGNPGKWVNKRTLSNGFVDVYGSEHVRIDINDYKVSYSFFGYLCSNSIDRFKLKYKPIKMFGLRYILCYSRRTGFMLCDRKNDEYESISISAFYDNLIIGSKTYLMHDEKKIDITDYYNKYLKNNIMLKVNTDLDLLSKDEFYVQNIDNVKEMLKADKNNTEGKQLESSLVNAKSNEERVKLENLKIQSETIEIIEEAFKKLGELEGKTGVNAKIRVDNIFVKSEDHLEINPNLIKFLRYIDLRGILFKNVKMTGIDFSGSNISLYPEDVYQKDLSGCNFEGVFIDSFTNFNGVDIRGAKFGDGVNKNELGGIQNVTFKNAIYNDTTTYDGIPFTELYGPCEKLSNKKRS